MNERTMKKDQKCWHCRNISTCEWGKSGEPVEGWDAEKTKINIGDDKYIDTYDIRDCPKFEQGTPEIIQNYDVLVEEIIERWRIDFIRIYLEVLIEEFRFGRATEPTKKKYEIERKKAIRSILSDLYGEQGIERVVERAEIDAEMYFDIAEEWANGADEKELAEKVGEDRFDIALKLLKNKEPFKTKRIESLKRNRENDII